MTSDTKIKFIGSNGNMWVEENGVLKFTDCEGNEISLTDPFLNGLQKIKKRLEHKK